MNQIVFSIWCPLLYAIWGMMMETIICNTIIQVGPPRGSPLAGSLFGSPAKFQK